MNICSNCKFSIPHPENKGMIICQRFPPQVFLIDLKRDENGRVNSTETLAIYPQLGPMNTCGEFARSEDAIDV